MIYTKLCTIATAAALVIAVGCGGAKKEETAAETPAGGGTASGPVFKVDPATAAAISGKVTLAGAAPARRAIDMSAEPDCKKLHSTPQLTEEVVAGSGGALANVFVYVKAGLEGKNFAPAADAVKLDQKGCIYHPHVFGVQVGQKLDIANSDPTTHNIHPMPKVNREWNQSQAPGTPDLDKEFARPEVMIPVKCNVHPWMRSYIGVVDNPYFAVTGEDGSFSLKNLPPGDYTVEFWHEKYGTGEQKVTLAASGAGTADFQFKAE